MAKRKTEFDNQFDEPTTLTFTKQQLQILIKLFDGKRDFEPDERFLVAYLKYQEQKQ